MDKQDLTPVYIAECPHCGAWRGCSVVDAAMPDTLKQSLRDRKGWQRDGYTVLTSTVDAWNSAPRPDKFKHKADCAKAA